MTPEATSPRRAFVQHQVGLLEPFGFIALTAPRPGSPDTAALVEVSRSEEGSSYLVIAGALPSLDDTVVAALTSAGFAVADGRASKDGTDPAAATDAAEAALAALDVDPAGRIDLKHGSHRADVERERKRAAALERIGNVLRTILAPDLVTVDGDGDFSFPFESTRVFVGVRALRGGALVVRVFSITNVDVEASPGLGLFLATTNFGLAFGRFSLDVNNNAVWFEHNLPGEAFADDELAVVVRMVAQTANEFDERIAEMFGGELFNPPGEAGPPEAPKDDRGAPGYL